MAYFPNGTSAEAFYNECASCPLGELPCPIALVQELYNYDACNNATASEILDDLVADSGRCAMRPLIDDLAKRHGVDAKTAWNEEQLAALAKGRGGA